MSGMWEGFAEPHLHGGDLQGPAGAPPLWVPVILTGKPSMSGAMSAKITEDGACASSPVKGYGSGVPLPPEPAHNATAPGCLLRPVPTVGRGDRYFNTQKCREGRRCENKDCNYWHSFQERRCKRFAAGELCGRLSGRCTDGLHVEVAAISQTLQIDLEMPKRIRALVHGLEGSSVEERAKYVRLVVYGFAAIRSALLQRVCAVLPLLHEIVLPDRVRESYLLVALTDTIERCASSNPRLRDVVFEDGCVEAVW